MTQFIFPQLGDPIRGFFWISWFILILAGIFLIALSVSYSRLGFMPSNLTAILMLLFFIIGVFLLKIYIFGKKIYRFEEIKNGKTFEIINMYKARGYSRMGIRFEKNDRLYFISSIPPSLKDASCGEKYRKRNSMIFKISD